MWILLSLQLKWIQYPNYLVGNPVVCSLHHSLRNSVQMLRFTKVQWDLCNSYFHPAGKLPLKTLKEEHVSDALTSTPSPQAPHPSVSPCWADSPSGTLHCCYYNTNPLLCKAHSECTALNKATLFPAARCWICQKQKKKKGGKKKRKVREFHYKCKNVYCCCCCTALHPMWDNSSLIKLWWMIDMASG